MKCKLVKIDSLSGKEASIYSVYLEDESTTLFEKFVNEYSISFKSETKDIIQRLRTIGTKTGARVQFFKEWEGAPGDGVCALYDIPNSNLRLYCIRISINRFRKRRIQAQIDKRITGRRKT